MKRLLKKLLSYLPTGLPVGMTEFNKFTNDVIELSGKYADEDSMRFAIASMITHLKHTEAYIPKNYFVKCLRSAAAKQVAGQVFQDIKQKQLEAQEAAKKAAEVTAQNKVTDDGQEIQTP